MILIECPNCGSRNALEFRYGGEYNPRPPQPAEVPNDAWSDYVYMKANKSGYQKEWWFHRAGCQLWFVAERNTKSNEIRSSYTWQPGQR